MHQIYYGLFLMCSIFHLLQSAPVQKFPAKALNFMKKFGYIEQDDGESEALYSEEGISNIIKTLQKFGAIEETGIIDNATLKLMSSPRCGVPDIIKHKRQKRFHLGPSGWNKRHLKYYIANWSPKLGEQTVEKNIQLALDMWGKYGRLTFERVATNDADIIVAFGRGYHGDNFPFDGPGQILAHAFFPYEFDDFGGDIHFDDDEDWIDKHSGGDTADGTDFFTVALHELGHSLGLAHSVVPNSIMFPYYQGYDDRSQFKLDYDDILGMYQLYISRRLEDDDKLPEIEEDFSSTSTPRTTEVTTRFTRDPTTEASTHRYPTTTEYYSTRRTTYTPTTDAYNNITTTLTYFGDDESVDDHKKHDPKHNIPINNSPSLPNICDGHFDAAATLRRQLFVFKDEYVWRLEDKGRIMSGYPVPLLQMFPSLPQDIKKIDAAYERSDGMIVLFTGNLFWVYDGSRFIEDSPRPLSDYGLPESLANIDAIQVWGRNSKTYFYKQDRFWRYNETAKAMDPGYPQHMEKWRQIPESLDSAVTWIDGVTYFFKAGLFWKFDNEWVIATDESPFPTAQIWFGCPEDYRVTGVFNREDNT